MFTLQELYHINAMARSTLYGDVKTSATALRSVREALESIIDKTDEAEQAYREKAE